VFRVAMACLWTGAYAQTPRLQSPSKAKAAVAHGECRLCHRPHTTAMAQNAKAALAKKGSTAFQTSALDEVCLSCHQGPSAPATDLGASKLPAWSGNGSSHIDGPILERARTFARSVDRGSGRRTVLRMQCDGCHDVHAKDRTSSLSPMAFDAQGKYLRTKPVNTSQMCFGCHAGPEAARLSKGESDLGALMGPSAISSHRPGATAAARPDLPSLKSGLFGGTLDCISCHNSSNAGGPSGPHASSNAHLLKAPYGREGDVATTGTRANDLCFTCHDRISIEGNQSFPLHAQHISGFTGLSASKVAPKNSSARRTLQDLSQGWRASPLPGGASFAGFGQPTACATCHDAHGSGKNAGLVAFDPAIVTRSSVGVISYQKTGLRQGNCTLTCHGYDHVQTRY
jgi:hypothetical protein